MLDDNRRYGSPRPEEIYRNESSREGLQFDDSNLTLSGYKQTVYDYTLPDGFVLYQQCRYDDDNHRAGVDERKKKFLPRRPRDPEDYNRRRASIDQSIIDRDSHFVYGPGDRRVAYNWPAIIKSGPATRVGAIPLFIAEGEKKAKDLIDRGVLATCAISNDWSAPECHAAVAGFEVFILEDNDESGKRIAAATERFVSKVARSTRIVSASHLWSHLPPDKAKGGLPPNADVSDWLDLGGDPTKLIEICREIPAEGSITAKPHAFKAEADIPPWEFLYDKHLLRGSTALTAAEHETGKSSKAIAEALAMTSGRNLLRATPLTHLRVLLINIEDDRNTMDRRICAAMKYYELTPEHIGDRLITIAKGELKLKIASSARQGLIQPNEAAIRELIRFALEHKIDVISIDPLRRSHRVPENDNVAMDEMVELFDTVAEEANCAVHLWHHTRKSNGGETTIDSIRGASAIVDVPRSAEVMVKMSAAEATKFGIDPLRRRYYFRTFSGKLNFAPPIEHSKWFELKSVLLENAFPFGDDVGVVTVWFPPDATQLQLSPEDLAKVKAEIGFTPKWRTSSQSVMWVGRAVATALGLNLEADKVRIRQLIAALEQAKVLKTVEGKDSNRKPVPFTVVP